MKYLRVLIQKRVVFLKPNQTEISSRCLFDVYIYLTSFWYLEFEKLRSKSHQMVGYHLHRKFSYIAIVLYVGTPWGKCVVDAPILFTPSKRKLLYLGWIDCIAGNLFPVMWVSLLSLANASVHYSLRSLLLHSKLTSQTPQPRFEKQSPGTESRHATNSDTCVVIDFLVCLKSLTFTFANFVLVFMIPIN
jgi:hypothetical protein